jgi:leucyl-tRNA synthetase
MFPYPSGATMHVGHASNYIPVDVMVRQLRMKGHKVINPIGRDSFGLPTENFAIKQGRSAHEVTKENIAKFKEQLHKMDMDYDRDREFATSDPEYYKRTQWVFLKLFEAGLVYRKDALVNRCPTDQTVIANDQVVDGKCERCGTEIIQKKHPQWFIKITDYADRLISDLDLVDRPEETKAMQKNWIGKSEGAEIFFTNVQNVQKDQTKIMQFS